MKKRILFYLFLLGILFVSCKTKQKAEELLINKESTDFQSNDEVKFKYFYVEGAKQMMLENYDYAKEMFESCLELNPKSAASLFHLSKIYSVLGDKEQAIVLSRAAIRENSKNIWYKLFLVELYNYIQNYEESSKLLETLIQEDKYNENLYLELSELYVLQKDYASAIEVLERLEKQTQVSNQISDYKIQIYFQLQDFVSISKELESLIERNPESIKYHGMLAEIYAKMGKDLEASQLYERLNELAPEDGKTQVSAAFYYFRSKNYEKSRLFQIKAFSNVDANLNAKMELFIAIAEMEPQVYEEQHLFDLLDLLSTAHPDSVDVKLLHYNYLNYKNDKISAYPVLLEILKIRKSDYNLWQQLVLMQIELNLYEDLIESTQEAIIYYPNQPIFYYFLGYGYNRTGKFQEAVFQLETAQSLIIDDLEFEQEVLQLLGESHYKMKNFEKSFSYFDQILEKNPQNSLVLNNYSYYLALEKQQLSKALSMSKLANELVIDNANFLDTQAWILFQMSEYSQAQIIIEKALALSQNKSGVILEHYGDILWKLNLPDKALQQWILSKNLGNNSKLLEQKIFEKKYIE
jgi:tetratricopeptide (TPR) repeat protein